MSFWAVLLYFFSPSFLWIGGKKNTTRHGTMLIALALEARTLRFFVCVCVCVFFFFAPPSTL